MSEQSNNPTFSADLDDGTVRMLEAHAGSQVVSQQRRMALSICARDAEALLQLAREEPRAFETMAGLVLDFQEHAHAVDQMANSALARVTAVRQAVWGDVFDA